jgi:2-amino-4-hydroxy-6-hydroxymethyldihydropteridine diphosphokinase
MNGIYLLLGSNLGNSFETLGRASKQIEKNIGAIVRASGIYKTKAWGIVNQPDFLNRVIEINSELSPTEMLKQINIIESNLGRVRYKKWHERIIDIDILYFGNEIINTADLQVPHPENQNRKFVMVPMAELAPNFIHPILGKSQKYLLENCKDPLGVELY